MLPSLSLSPSFVLATPHGIGDLGSPIRDQTLPTLERWSPAHWTTREVPLSPMRTPLMDSGPPRFRMTSPQSFPSLLLQGPRFQVRHILSLGISEVPSGVSLLGHMCALDECPGLGPADPTLPPSSPLCCSLSCRSHGAPRGACASPRDEAHTLGGPWGLGRESPCVLGDGQPEAIGCWAGAVTGQGKALGPGPGSGGISEVTHRCHLLVLYVWRPPQTLGEQGRQEGQRPHLPQCWGTGGLQGRGDGPQCPGVTGAGRGHGACGWKGLGVGDFPGR